VTTGQADRRRVVVADDDRQVREAMIDLLQDEPSIDVVAGAGDGAETVAVCLVHRPDVLVLDVNMPEGGGERAASELRVELPELVIIAVSANADRVTRRRMADAGAAAFLAKGAMGDLVAMVIEGPSTVADA
jgi:DNA-binding NarL/FixJ family response regulator